MDGSTRRTRKFTHARFLVALRRVLLFTTSGITSLFIPRPRNSCATSKTVVVLLQLLGIYAFINAHTLETSLLHVTSELDNEIDELAGDGDTYVARLAEGEGEGGSGVRSRPKRAAAVAAVAANRSARWDEGLDLGEDVEEDDEDDDEDEDDAGPDGDGVMDDDYDEEEEDMMDKPSYGRGRGLPRGRGGAMVGGPGAGRGRAIASSGGPMFGAVAPFRSQQPSFGMVPEDYHGRAPEAEAMEE
ncbi:hypothetical protein FRC20_005162 [Serendipita sp. 405]|nr:hypothetical protein FRC20_005162 [Serendipita sp. 405]